MPSKEQDLTLTHNKSALSGSLLISQGFASGNHSSPPIHQAFWRSLYHPSNDETSDTTMSENLTGNYTAEDLWNENDSFARTVVPSMLYVALLMVIGVPGNSLVVYVYGFRFRTATQHVLIVCLAVCDLIIGLIAMPTEIADLRFHLTFTSDFACRLLRFVSLFCALTSNCILIVIAVDRYRRVCRPLHHQMTVKEARIGTVLAAILALFVSWPLLVITGLRTTKTNLEGLYGKDCSFSDKYKNSVYPIILNGVLGTGFVIMMFVLIVLYAKIWRQARNHRLQLKSKYLHFKGKTSSTSSLPGSPTSLSEVSSVRTRPSSESSVEQFGSVFESEVDLSVTSHHHDTQSSETENREISIISRNSSVQTFTEMTANSENLPDKRNEKRLCCSCFQNRKDWSLDKATLVAFAITVVFILSFLPYLILMAVRSVKRNFDHTLTGSVELNVYNIFVRSYFLNSAANPVIYGVFNARFRRECVGLFTRTASCLCFCRKCVSARNAS